MDLYNNSVVYGCHLEIVANKPNVTYFRKAFFLGQLILVFELYLEYSSDRSVQVWEHPWTDDGSSDFVAHDPARMRSACALGSSVASPMQKEGANEEPRLSSVLGSVLCTQNVALCGTRVFADHTGLQSDLRSVTVSS